MATIREKRPGVWEVRVFTGTDAKGKPTQVSRTVHGGKRDAQRVAAELTVGPGQANAGGRTVSDVLDAWVEQNLPTWAASSAYDNQSRVRSIKKDPIVTTSLARLSAAPGACGTRGGSTHERNRTVGEGGDLVRSGARWRRCRRQRRRDGVR